MGAFSDNFTILKKASEPLYKTPRSIQETIEILKVAENGIFSSVASFQVHGKLLAGFMEESA